METPNSTTTEEKEGVMVALTVPNPPDNVTGDSRPKGVRFWIVILAVCLCLFLSALEYTGVSTSLPTIVHDLDGDDFVWVGSAYALSSTALLPATGGMAQIFGRRVTMLSAQALFALGSALCGSARNMNWLIAGRAVQGAGGGALQAITQIVISDLVPLRERPLYNGIIGMTWCIASGMGPVVGGALTERGQWRWLFYLNLPLTGLAAVMVVLTLKLKTPGGSFRAKILRMDWIGNILVISSTCAVIIGLTWGGAKSPWGSANVIVPLVVGFVGLMLFFLYEATYAVEPLIPFTLVANRTSLSGYIQNFVGPIVGIAAIYFLPVYFQACKDASPLRSGVELFGLAMSLGPVLLLSNAVIAVTKTYRVLLWFSWALTVAAMGALSTLRPDSSLAATIGFQVILGVGGGIFYGAVFFPILAALPVTENAHAVAFIAFGRQFASVWGVTIGTAVLQTQLSKHLPAEFLAQLPGGVSIAYSLVSVIPTLPEPFRSEVQLAFARSIGVIWQVMIGVSAAGAVASLFMRGVPLNTKVDKDWGLENRAPELEKGQEHDAPSGGNEIPS